MRSRKPNPKRKIREAPCTDLQRNDLAEMAQGASYTGNPVHKRNPGDYNLVPPAGPRPGKTLCDGAEVFSRRLAMDLLREGFRQGLVSVASRGDWPQNVWAVAPNGIAVEAMLEDNEGRYHGYPLQVDDPIAAEVKRRWEDQ